ncbi:MAG: ABC transporter ATP-binding protein/permease [Leptospiraceae bacterium]|nr:ABC transporter ATP-binding protein/permease [Leptospiraceae bacterium]
MRQFDTIHESGNNNHLRTLAFLGRYLWPAGHLDLKVRVTLAVAALLTARGISVYTPMLFRALVDHLGGQSRLEWVPLALATPIALVVSYGLARILQQLFGELRDFAFIRVAQHAQRTIALQTFQHLHQLSLAFHLERQTGGLSRVIERGIRGIQFVLTFMLFNILPTLVEIVLVTSILVYEFNALFGGIAFGTIAIYIAFTLIVTDWRLKYRKQMNQSDSEANNKAIDSLLNFETVKYFGNEEHEYQRYDTSLARYETAAVKSQRSLGVLNLGQGTVIGIGLVLILAMAVNGVENKQITIGDFVLINTYMIQLFLPLNFLGFVYREVKQSLIDMDKMFELRLVDAEIADAPNAAALQYHAPGDGDQPAGQATVEFRDVHFAYQSNRPILKEINFTVQPGHTVAIVGPSGAGKSTISRLLFRFYDIQSGSIQINGQDIRQYTQQSLRAAIGIVPQDTVLFNDTIAYNIQYGNPSAGPEQIEHASRLAQIHDFVEGLPERYETRVGERGLKLSGGEKQRVAIARTILKNPAILLLDEATSALDSHTEKEIQSALQAVARGRTTLIIAHRLSTIVDADEILVLKAGQIVERGRHTELLQAGGEYYQMWQKQQEVRRYEAELERIGSGD